LSAVFLNAVFLSVVFLNSKNYFSSIVCFGHGGLDSGNRARGQATDDFNQEFEEDFS
jgi:hypothetical protein